MDKNELNQELPKELVIIYSTEDEKIKEIGKMLVSDTGRKILELLFSETLTAKQIAEKTNLDIPLVKHHVNRMLDLGIIKIAKIEKSVKMHDMKYYKAIPHAIVILPPYVMSRAKNSKMLIRSLKTIYRLMSIGSAAVVTWFGTQFIQHYNYFSELNLNSNIPVNSGDTSSEIIIDAPLDFWLNIQPDTILSAVATSGVIIAGLLFTILRKKK